MSKYAQYPKADLPLDTNNVGQSCGGKFTFDANGDWRWMTTEETAAYNADHARHDDDGFGGAIGLVAEGNTSDIDTSEDDLGPKWGLDIGTQPEDDEQARAIRTAASKQSADDTTTPNFLLEGGQRPTLAAERALADEAIKLINSTVGNLDTTRYVLIALHMEDVDAATSSGHIRDYSILSTSDTNSLVKVAQNERYNELERMIQSKQMDI